MIKRLLNYKQYNYILKRNNFITKTSQIYVPSRALSNAQEWLDKNYPVNGNCQEKISPLGDLNPNFGKKRNEIKQLDISHRNLTGSLKIGELKGPSFSLKEGLKRGTNNIDSTGFTSLEDLNCSGNQLTNLSLSLVNLKELDCSDNRFDVPDIKNCPHLKKVNNFATPSINESNLGIVGFSYEVTNLESTKPLELEIFKSKKPILGSTTKYSQKIEIAHGYGYSDDYGRKGYGRSYIYLDNKGPFYSIVGGSSLYTSKEYKGSDSGFKFTVFKEPEFKKRNWGINLESSKAVIEFRISEGYDWITSLNQGKGDMIYSRIYLNLLQDKSRCNVLGGKIQATSIDSTIPWNETGGFGKNEGKENVWGILHGWNEKIGKEGYNRFILYTDEVVTQQLLKKQQQLQVQIEVPPKQ